MKVHGKWVTMIVALGLCFMVSCAATDTGITAKVKTRLAMDDQVKSSQIEVATADGTVTLTGNVDSEAAKEQALELTRSMKGVVTVVDMISVRRAAGSGDAPAVDRTMGEVVQDSGITINVKGRLLDDPLVKGLRIDVDTREGVVFLTGSVGSEAQKQKAIELAESAEGVKSVQANLTIKKA